ncbi:hypothetical protein [uncultured Secundilactobacillus sp.]|uniref:hypothetical protein n=1 Tax=uncultured Secundilactobacillus sp. TaxID=2813935 RepID=UPI002585AF5F|nr:hypothetical protein [uncultured Secundilactobacillus sp.]
MLKGILNAVIMLVSLFLCIGFVAVIHLTDSIVFIVLGILGFAIFSFLFLATLSAFRSH